MDITNIVIRTLTYRNHQDIKKIESVNLDSSFLDLNLLIALMVFGVTTTQSNVTFSRQSKEGRTKKIKN